MALPKSIHNNLDGVRFHSFLHPEMFISTEMSVVSVVNTAPFLKNLLRSCLKGKLGSVSGHAALVLETVCNKEQILIILKNEFKKLEALSSKWFNQKKQLESQKNLRKNKIAELQALIKFNNSKERKIFNKIKLYQEKLPAYVH